MTGVQTCALPISTLRLAPPLIITDQELATFTAALPGLLDAVATASAPEGEN